MALTLKNFKRTIPSTILTRGRDYFQSGRVVDLSLDGDDRWEVEVQGSEPYHITIAQQPDGSLVCECTCPYEFGEHCKHIAAALYAIEEGFPEYFERAGRKPARKRTSRMDRLREALQAAPPERLVATLLALAEGDREMQSQLLLLLGAADRPADIRALVKAAIRPPRGSHGFLDYWDADNAGRKVGEIVDRADRLRDAQPADALAIYQVVLEEVLTALENSDDSSGTLGYNVNRALEGMDECAERLSPEGRAALLEYCLQKALSPRFRNWGHGWQLLELAADLVETPAQREAVDAILEPFEISDKAEDRAGIRIDFDTQRAAAVKLQLIQRLDGDKAALAFISDHIQLPTFRMILIAHHLEEGDLGTARTLAQAGLDATKSDGLKYGIALAYHQLLLDIARQNNDHKELVEHARVLWLSRLGNEYYDLMASAVPREKWPAFRTRLLSDKACPRDLAAWAYARDGLWSEVRDIVLATPSLLPPYQLEMEARFPDETATMYERLAQEMLKGVSNRQTYHEAAGLLVRMQKVGRGEEGKAIARKLIGQYPQRRAMIEELRRVL